jgi:hypothetical protein
MGNQLATNPWVFDTAGASIVYQNDIYAAHFEWAGYNAQADNVKIKDRFGKIVWEATGKADLSLVESFTLEWLHGLVIDTLTAGRVRLFFE